MFGSDGWVGNLGSPSVVHPKVGYYTALAVLKTKIAVVGTGDQSCCLCRNPNSFLSYTRGKNILSRGSK